ncbi:hypothetical protein SM73_03007 [Klebsiella quasipneumoniae]|nr:hypothetical protein [Klebsiella quasipneumoniae]KMH48524.1 hypothetical protein SM73_03007 [Klebsiella quasipneumoniae]
MSGIITLVIALILLVAAVYNLISGDAANLLI